MEGQTTDVNNNGNANTAAQAAANSNGQAPGEGNQQTDQNNNSGGLDYSDPKATEAAVAALRKENAKYRTQNKELSSKVQEFDGRFSKLEKGLKGLFGEDDANSQQVQPEDAVNKLTERLSDFESKQALLEMAYEHEIPKDQRDYFEFLLVKESEKLGDGEALSDEVIAQVAQKAKGAQAPQDTNTSVHFNGKKGDGDVNNNNQQKPPQGNTGSQDKVTLEQFVTMSMMEKSKLYQEDQAHYNALLAQAKEKKILVK